MKTQCLLFLFLGLVFTLCARMLPVSARGRPGRCPTPPRNITTECIANCNTDWDCPAPWKCCRWGCMKDCLSPVFVRPPTTPGHCPKPQGARHCADRCTRDVDCRAGEKCCSNGCGYECMKATGEHPPRSPGRRPRPQDAGHCAQLCRRDSDCSEGEECRSNGCGRECMRVSGE